jgi:hypothetical protein
MMPTVPDGTPEDEDGRPGPNIGRPPSGRLGKEGRPTHYTGKPEDFVHASRYPLRAQISALTDELEAIRMDLYDWGQVARAEFVPGHKSRADWVLGWLWEVRQRKRSLLLWLREQIPVDPVTGQNLEDY